MSPSKAGAFIWGRGLLLGVAPHRNQDEPRAAQIKRRVGLCENACYPWLAPALLAPQDEVVREMNDTTERLLKAIRGNPRGSYREWAQAAGISSTSVVGHHLDILAAEKKVRLTPGKARSVELVEKESPHAEPAPRGLPDSGHANRPVDPALQGELNFYRDMCGAVCLLYERSQALDAMASNPEDEQTQAAWSSYWDAAEDLFEYVRTIEHADAMEAAGVMCNELAHSHVVLTA